MVNSCSAHLVGEWVEAQTLQGVILEETILASPKDGKVGETGVGSQCKRMQTMGVRFAR